MKLFVFSDSHRLNSLMLDLVLKHTPDKVLHLGDHDRDALWLQHHSGVEVVRVAGNCDPDSKDPLLKILNINGRTIFMAHGHIQGVKYGIQNLIKDARAMDADIALFGHTHIPLYTLEDNMHVMNPGSITCPDDGGKRTYGVIDIDDNGKIQCRIESIN